MIGRDVIKIYSYFQYLEQQIWAKFRNVLDRYETNGMLLLCANALC